jgi:hypothetical protein
MEILTEIQIDAPADTVWKVLVNFPDYGSWNPVITKIDGMPYRGNKINFTIQAALAGSQEGSGSAAGTMPFLPQTVQIPIMACEILIADSGQRELRWKGPAIPIASDILAGEHYFIVKEEGPQKSRFIHGENFTGLAAGILKPLLEQRLNDSYNEMNRALKKRCEGG